MANRPFLRNISLDDLPDFGSGHPFDLPAIAALRHGLKLHPKVTFFVGENGTGKSTILEALADKWGFSMKSGNRVSHPGLRSCMTKRFLDAPERMMKQLLADEEE